MVVMVHKIVYNCARSEGSNGKCMLCMRVVVCNCMGACVLKKVSPSSPGHSQDFFASLFFINSLSNTHPFSNIGSVTFLLLVLGLECCLFWVKNVEFIDILGILVLLDRGRCRPRVASAF